ncbi:hypothetical protein ACFXO9_08640 [Nocardia tengchongensis]|uniref:hypothetical protein n=1 Tax=Nocardia tengchongensis TaxID=2055889 RepID=UPI0036793C5F
MGLTYHSERITLLARAFRADLPARGFGGTADVVATAHARGLPVTVLWPEGAERP